MKKIFYLVITICLMLYCIPGMVNATGESSFDFLKIGDSAHALAVGEAVISIAEGIDAMKYNPAGLVDSKNLKLGRFSATYIKWLHEMNYINAGVVKPLAVSSQGADKIIGLKFSSLSHTPFTEIDEFGNELDSMNAGDMAVTIGYGVGLEKIKAGMNLNYLRSVLDDSSASAFTIDLGIMYSFALPVIRTFKQFASDKKENLLIGFSARNIFIGLNSAFEKQGGPLPAIIGVGMDYLAVKNLDILLDMCYDTDSGFLMNSGLQYALFEILKIRAGYKLAGKTTNKFSAGAGIEYAKKLIYSLDLAYIPNNLLGNNIAASFGVAF